MKRLEVLFFLVVVSIFSCKNSSDEHNNIIHKIKKSPHDFMFMQRAYPSGELKTDAYSKAIQWKKEQTDRNANANLLWEFAGPFNIGGRITDIEIPIDARNVLCWSSIWRNF